MTFKYNTHKMKHSDSLHGFQGLNWTLICQLIKNVINFMVCKLILGT